MGNPYESLKEYEGQWLKYPQLCEVCGEKQRSGKSKQLQLKRIEQYVDIQRDNGKIYIGRVYSDDDELQIVESYGRFTSYIRQFLINLFSDFIYTTNDCELTLTNKDILEATSMVNGNYFIGKNAPYKYLNYFDIEMNQEDVPTTHYITDKILDESKIFFSGSYRLLKRVIYDSLTSLEHASLIKKGKTFRLYRNTTDEFGRFHSKQHDCTPDEESRILTVQHDAIKEYNEEIREVYGAKSTLQIKSYTFIHYLPQEQKKRYYSIVRRRLEEEFKEEGWTTCSTAWKITLAQPDTFDYERQRINYNQLNQNVQDKLLTSKDLSVIENALRLQFVNTFIKVENND